MISSHQENLRQNLSNTFVHTLENLLDDQHKEEWFDLIWADQGQMAHALFYLYSIYSSYQVSFRIHNIVYILIYFYI